MAPVIAVVGPGEGASPASVADATLLGRLLAQRGWTIVCGGRASGVMAAVAASATASGGLVIGLLPGMNRDDAAPALTVALPTGLGEARNVLVVTAADAVVGCGMSTGTASEIALALHARKPTVLVRCADEDAAFFRRHAGGGQPFVAATVEEAVAWLAERCSSG